MRTIIYLFVLPASGLLSCCSNSNVNRISVDRDSEMGRSIAQLDLAEKDYYVRAEREKYLEAAKNFVREAQAGNLKSMMAMTSPLTIRASGRTTITRVYETQVIPQFEGTQVSWKEPSEIITDDTGNRGYVVSGRVTGGRSFPVYVTVMKERSQFRVITLSQKR
jgi:hypothetical protein